MVACLSPIGSFQAYDKKITQTNSIYLSGFFKLDHVTLANHFGDYIIDMNSKRQFYELKRMGVLSSKLVESRNHAEYLVVLLLSYLPLFLTIAINNVKSKLRYQMGAQ